MKNNTIPTVAHHDDAKEHLKFLLLGIATLWEGFVMVASLGFLVVYARAWLLFDKFED